jgi:hypothetical protein
MNFKSFCFAIVFISVISFSCSDDENSYQSTGLITGPDLAFCACCGGHFIEIADSIYRFDNLPGSSDIDLPNVTFPIFVNLDWRDERDCGGFRYIEITRIEIKN